MRNPTSNRFSTTLRSTTVIMIVAFLCGACQSIGPKPWEKDLMARKEMQFNAYSVLAGAKDHVYFSKEASSGGSGFAGGGCGCN